MDSVALPHDLRMRFRSRTNPEIFQKKREFRFLIFFRVERGFIIINQRTRAAIAYKMSDTKWEEPTSPVVATEI
jgi:hypothetical protein